MKGYDFRELEYAQSDFRICSNFIKLDERNLFRFQFVFTPKHGSWLKIDEIELKLLNKQCLNRRIDSVRVMQKEVKAWMNQRNNKNAKINWQFTPDDTRIKLKRMYPSVYD